MYPSYHIKLILHNQLFIWMYKYRRISRGGRGASAPPKFRRKWAHSGNFEFFLYFSVKIIRAKR